MSLAPYEVSGPCVWHGGTIGYNSAAYQQAPEQVAMPWSRRGYTRAVLSHEALCQAA
jgi:hypothetical protein